MPQTGDWWRRPDEQINFTYPYSEEDQDCGLILEGTASMTEFEANVWFCENHGNHTVFERQTWLHNLPQGGGPYKSHAKKCGVWLKDPKREKERA